MTRKGKLNITMETVKEINRLYIKGYNMVMVGKLLNISHGCVCKYVHNPRKSGTYTEIRGIEI